ncbi:hypothetical protein EJ377_17380 [Chryseobacterium arthrosphaerae]|uniref:Uncharacterized protein n=1 Tax=Chryseobacterium arthrosphaerae TaxID=651561 RepID=A0A3S0Q4G2_9FLAO|nr:hypothetical protein EJ377_17380 [Chryseobacterium arthrosphaerae]
MGSDCNYRIAQAKTFLTIKKDEFRTLNIAYTEFKSSIMEENKLDKGGTETYFETGKYPTENQFSDLIDSLKLKEISLPIKMQ